MAALRRLGTLPAARAEDSDDEPGRGVMEHPFLPPAATAPPSRAETGCTYEHRLVEHPGWTKTSGGSRRGVAIAMEDLTRDAVLKAIADFDERGSEEFFRHHGIRRSRSYFIRYHGQEYDMKAVTRVALGLVSGRQAIRAKIGKSETVNRRLERDDIRIKVVHHEEADGQTGAEGRRNRTKRIDVKRDSGLADKAMRLNRRRHGGWIKCEACGFRDKERSMFDAHHLSPLVLGERESLLSELVVLCPTCHRWAHAKAGDKRHPLPVKHVRRGRRRAGQRNKH